MKDIITSSANPQVRSAMKLRKRRERDRQKLMIIDGIRPLEAALGSGVEIRIIYYDTSRENSELLSLAAKKGVPVQPLSPETAEKLCYGDNPDGHLGIAEQPSLGIEKLRLPPNPLLVITESLEKPGNIGAVIRSADAAGADAHIMCSPVTDVYNPNLIRSSQGTVFTLPQALLPAEEAIRWLDRNSIKTFAAFPGEGIPYTQADFTGASAICVGNEHSGLSDPWRKTNPVHIKMRGAADSLNAAQAATVILFEALRQRESSGL